MNPSDLTVGLIVLTTGDRPDDLATIMSQAAALDFDERVLVSNGVAGPRMAGWTTVDSTQNLGVPGGRSFGMEHSTSDVMVFLDDDSQIPGASSDLVSTVRAVFTSDSRTAALAFRVVITGTDETLRRWSPRPTRAATTSRLDVPTFPGNGHALRRTAFDDVGGYVNEMFFKHEETELSWRLLDAGWRVVTDPAAVVEHPNTTEARHERAIELGLRNKIWMSRLRLPLLPALLGAAVSTGRSLSRCRSGADVIAVSRGIRSGLGSLPQRRQPISWSTVVKLTKLGRPPIF